MKQRFAIASTLFALGCAGSGGNFIGPAGDVALVAGPYTLTVARTSASSCFAIGAGPNSSIQLNMTVAAITNGWRATLSDAGAGDLVLTLTRDGARVTGQAVGRGTATATTLVVDNAVSGGADTGANSATGSIAGSVTYRGAGGDTVCTENTWALARR